MDRCGALLRVVYTPLLGAYTFGPATTPALRWPCVLLQPRGAPNGCRGENSLLSATSHHTSSTAPGQWVIRVPKEPLEKRMPAFLCAKPWQGIKSPHFHGVFQKAWVQGMSIANVIGCFRATGVYPIDRRVPLSQLRRPQETSSSPTRSAPTPFVPFCTPRKEGATDTMPAYTEPPELTTFTADEVEQFQARFQQSTDSRYALWLETFHPQSSAKVRPGALETILKWPPPPAQ